MTAVRDKLGFFRIKNNHVYRQFLSLRMEGVDVLLDAAEYLPEQYLVVLVGADESEYKRHATQDTGDVVESRSSASIRR